jgi:hypothetical protein
MITAKSNFFVPCNSSQKEEINPCNKEFYHAVAGLELARFPRSITANIAT